MKYLLLFFISFSVMSQEYFHNAEGMIVVSDLTISATHCHMGERKALYGGNLVKLSNAACADSVFLPSLKYKVCTDGKAYKLQKSGTNGVITEIERPVIRNGVHMDCADGTLEE